MKHITLMCTAMRRGDCCRLQWKDVDLGRGFVTVKTAKTGGTVSIPIFGLLRDELTRRAEKAGGGSQMAEARGQKAGRSGPGRAGQGKPCRGDGFVFPEQAAMYGVNPDGITRRVKKVLWAALTRGGAANVGEAEKAEPDSPKQEDLPEVPAAEVRKRGEAYLAKMAAGERRERMERVFRLYLDGGNAETVAKGAGISQGSVSGYLNEIETAIKCKVLRWRAGGGLAKAVKADGSVLRAERAGGLRRASVRDFHSLRVTWVTLALTAGVPLELVQRVTGHKTTDVVLKHYFRPGQEEFRLALEGAMPKLLTVGTSGVQSSVVSDQKTAKEEMRELADRVKPNALRERLVKVWAKW